MSVPMMHLSTFQSLFKGHQSAYGQHIYAKTDKGEKEQGTNKTVTGKLLTELLYKAHLEGKTGLGIVPINEDSKCRFTVLDVDIYDRNLMPYILAIEQSNLPIVPFYSKSKGLHLYTFYKEFIGAKEAVRLATEAARALGISLLVKQVKNETLEIFPKQLKLQAGQTGNWINLPYFNGDSSVQKVVKADGTTLELSEGLTYAVSKITTVSSFTDTLKALPYGDAPPCIQTMLMLNGPGKNNGRNNFLFSCGVYLKKKDENYFEPKLIEINEGLDEPLPAEEVQTTIKKSLQKKDYTYRCTVSPCIDYCDKKICQKREYGIGQGYFSNLIIGDMVQFKGYEPYYEWEVKKEENDKFSKLRFNSEDEIIRQDAFLKLCMREIRFLPYKMKQVEWFKLVNQALAEISVVEIAMEDDTSEQSLFMQYLSEFFTGRSRAETLSQILSKRILVDKQHQEYWFRTQDLLDFMVNTKKVLTYSKNQLYSMLTDLEVRRFQKRIDGKMIRLVAMKVDKLLYTVSDIKDPTAFDVEFEDYGSTEDF